MTFGYSRDDIGSFLPAYLEKGRAVAKDQKKAFKLGVCGEHGGDPYLERSRLRPLALVKAQ